MTNQLEVKQVPFMGTNLMAARDTGGQIWAGVRWMCDGMGLSRNQRDGQIQKIKTDRVISKGAENLPLPTNGGEQNVLCLKLDFIPLWLAKISITPAMQKERPEVADKLVQYQLKAQKVSCRRVPASCKSDFRKVKISCSATG
jgi:anti-repressor protein